MKSNGQFSFPCSKLFQWSDVGKDNITFISRILNKVNMAYFGQNQWAFFSIVSVWIQWTLDRWVSTKGTPIRDGSSETCPLMRLLSSGFWSWLRLGCVLSGWGTVIVFVFSIEIGLRTLAGVALASHVDARSCLRFLARLFWNHTWPIDKKRKISLHPVFNLYP